MPSPPPSSPTAGRMRPATVVWRPSIAADDSRASTQVTLLVAGSATARALVIVVSDSAPSRTTVTMAKISPSDFR